MVLSPEQRTELSQEFMKLKSQAFEPIDLTSPQILDAIGAMDDWVEANKELLLSSSTPEGNLKLTFKDKIWILMTILNMRLTQF